MAHLQAFRAAVDGKRPGNKAIRQFLGFTRRLLLAAAVLFVAWGSQAPAQSETFAGMAGKWSGRGTITLDDGSVERVRCQASYAVSEGGTALDQTLTCASDSYKFNLAAHVIAQGTALSGTWNENLRNVTGTIEGSGSGGNFQLVATGASFTARLTLTTRGNKQSVVIKSDGVFRTTSIALTRS